MPKKNVPSSKPPKSSDGALSHALRQQVSDLTEALKRERADAANVRRRADEERLKMAGYYKAAVIKQLLPVIDNFNRAIRHSPSANKPHDEREVTLEWIHGIKKIHEQFEQVLQNLGVTKIRTVNEPFNPKLHEAVTMEEGDGTKEMVAEELQAGYMLGDEVLRPAMVKVRMEK